MVSDGESKKASLPGRVRSLVTILKSGLGMLGVGSSRKKPRYVLRVKKNRPIGKVFYAVKSNIEPVTFYRKKDAKHFVELLNSKATADYNAVIIRREVTNEGFIPTYGDEDV